MSRFFEGLEPERVWHHFEEITKLPHGSGNEDALRQYIAAFASARGYDCHYKSAATSAMPGEQTLVIYKKASPGLEQKPTIVLQAHLDMVCVPNEQIFPLRLVFCDAQGRAGSGWVKADGTSLGADDGIGVAVTLALLEEDRYPLGPLEALFTVQEETGLIGAREFDRDLIHGRVLINLDEEDLTKITYGCAGGQTSMLRFPVNRQAVPSGWRSLRVAISGLQGGHSGVAIHQGGANAIRLLARVLSRAARRGIAFHLAAITAGNLSQSNVIPGQATATVVLEEGNAAKLETLVAEMTAVFREEYRQSDPHLQMDCQKAEQPTAMIDNQGTSRIVDLLMLIPHGVQKRGVEAGQEVETSTNLAAVTVNNAEAVILCQHRSSRESGLDWISDLFQSIAECTGINVSHHDRYPVWTPNEDSELLQKAKQVYEAQFGEDYETVVIHAGLECAWVIAKNRADHPVDCIALGPNVVEVHSVRERLEIASVASFYQVVLEILRLYAQ